MGIHDWNIMNSSSLIIEPYLGIFHNQIQNEISSNKLSNERVMECEIQIGIIDIPITVDR